MFVTPRARTARLLRMRAVRRLVYLLRAGISYCARNTQVLIPSVITHTNSQTALQLRTAMLLAFTGGNDARLISEIE